MDQKQHSQPEPLIEGGDGKETSSLVDILPLIEEDPIGIDSRHVSAQIFYDRAGNPRMFK